MEAEWTPRERNQEADHLPNEMASGLDSFPFCDVCFCSNRDSVDLPLLSCCCGFDRSSFVDISQFWGADDFQTQRRKGYMAGHVWKEEPLAKAVTIDGGKVWCGRCCSDGHSVCVAR